MTPVVVSSVPPMTPPAASARSLCSCPTTAAPASLAPRAAMGLRDRAYIVAHYRVPREVLNRLGGR
jgi:hypothetical protein